MWLRNDNPVRIWDNILTQLLYKLKRKTKTILFVFDLPIDQGRLTGAGEFFDSKSYELECRAFHCFDILCVFNRGMAERIRERCNIAAERFVEFECLVYGVRPSTYEDRKPPKGKWTLFYAGNGDRLYVGEWMNHLKRTDNVSYHFVGPNWDWLSGANRDDVTLHSQMAQQELCDYLHSNADFGIITYAEPFSSYAEYGCPSKFGAYVTAGVPILVNANCKYVASIVEKYDVGLSFDSFEQIPDILGRLSDSDYARLRERCQMLAEKLVHGYFLKRALAESLRKLHVAQG
jgi:hypothetical protein